MPWPAKVPFREYAKQHVATARVFLEKDAKSLRYACLELRLAIEALAYDTLQTYAEDNSPEVDKAMKVWQPKRILDHLKKYDPAVEMSLRIEFRAVPTGAGSLADQEPFVGVDRRFDAEWAGDAHHRMSQLLHQRTIAQLMGGEQIDEELGRRHAGEVLARLDDILASEIHGVRSDIRFGYPCPNPECDGDISVAMLALMQSGGAFTTCYSCNKKWLAGPNGEDNTPAFTEI